MRSQSDPSAQAPHQSNAQKGDLEYQKLLAQQLLDVMDEASLWHLAHELNRRGLIRVTEEGLEVVDRDEPSVPTTAVRTGQSDCPTRFQEELAESGDSATPADAEKKVQAGAAAPEATDSPAARPKEPEARWGTPLAWQGNPFFSPIAAAPGQWGGTPPAWQGDPSLSPTAAAPGQWGTPPASQGKPPYSPTAAAPGQEAAFAEVPIRAAPKQNNLAPDLGNIREKGKADEGACTTLILRNMPSDFDQPMAEEWVNMRGFQGLYDFLLFFPAKRAMRLNASSYVFVNFRSAEDARRFQRENHLTRLCAGRCALSIAAAKVQGFAENYARFHHLTVDGSPTLCQPFFAPDSVDGLSEEAHSAAAFAVRSAQRQGSLLKDPRSTLIIRNLPYSVDNQEGARDWLDRAGFAGEYDFLLYLPAKRRRPEALAAGGPPRGLAYAFVNFVATDAARACIEALSGKALSEGDPVLDVVVARVQGLSGCLRHFSNITDNGRVALWVAQGVNYEPPPPRYQ